MKQALPHVTGGSLDAVDWRIYVLAPQGRPVASTPCWRRHRLGSRCSPSPPTFGPERWPDPIQSQQRKGSDLPSIRYPHADRSSRPRS